MYTGFVLLVCVLPFIGLCILAEVVFHFTQCLTISDWFLSVWVFLFVVLIALTVLVDPKAVSVSEEFCAGANIVFSEQLKEGCYLDVHPVLGTGSYFYVINR